MRKISFIEKSLQELREYKTSEPKLVFKILELIQDIEKNPFEGLGKPEPLKGKMQGFWSRRISDEHRLVYRVTNDEIQIFSCRSHYTQF